MCAAVTCVLLQLAAVQASSDNISGKEAALSVELAAVKSELSGALSEKSELEEALGLMEQNNSAQVAALQVRDMRCGLQL